MARFVYGDSSSLWGTTWTPAEINSGNFGLVVRPDVNSDGQEFRVYNAEIEVFYTEIGGPVSTTLNFTMAIDDDTLAEGNESYSIVLSNPATTNAGGASLDASSSQTTDVIDDEIVFSLTGSSSVTEDAADGDNNQATYTIQYSGTLASGASASIDVGHLFNQTDGSDYTTDLAAAVNAAIVGTTGITFDGTTLTFH